MAHDLKSLLQIGCCGWPEARARYYQHFPVVELQDTFYEPPSLELAQKWREEAPPDFVFALKAWQLITHPASSPTYRRLKTPIEAERRSSCGFFRPTEEVWSAWERTRAIARALRAVAIVFQCPASFTPTAENKANLSAFFQRIERDGWLVIWEPRGSWEPAEVRELCQRLELVHCVDPFVARPTHGQAAYFRLHGRGGYRYRYTDQELQQLLDVCRAQVDAGRAPVFAMFNNVYMRDDALRLQQLVNRH